ncbi:MAG: TrmH family RNA methyltransferase, partial [Sciscionella sp.]
RRITTRNAAFQQWQSLLTNRTKRNRGGEFLVHGVRPITVAVDAGWPVSTLLYPVGAELSRWARELMDRTDASTVAVAPELLAELGEKGGGQDGAESPELVAVAGIPRDDLDRIAVGEDGIVVVFDRPSSPGNLGTVVRSADAFCGRGVIVTGHAADPYDPRAVRASTGSLFAVPTVRAPSQHEVLDWVDCLTVRPRVVGTDESANVDVGDADLTGPTLLVIGNETRGMSTGWRSACDELVRIPIGGRASSLNAATAAGVLLYESTRQRRAR